MPDQERSAVINFSVTDGTVEDLVRQYQSGVSLRALAEQCRCHRGTIKRRLAAAGVELRVQPEPLLTERSWWEGQWQVSPSVTDLAARLGVHR